MDAFFHSLDALPKQTAVFVVYDLESRKTHVLSMRTKVKYSVVRSLRETSFDGGVDPSTVDTIEREFAAGPVDGKPDEASFYNGVSGDELWSQILTEEEREHTLESQRRRLMENDETYRSFFGEPRLSAFTAVPYDFHPLDEEAVQAAVGRVIAEDAVDHTVGGFQLTVEPIESFGASFKQYVTGRFVTVKLDRPACLFETDLPDGDYVPETDLACFIDDETLEAVRTKAPEILWDGLWSRLDDASPHAALKDTKGWPVKVHEHLEL